MKIAPLLFALFASSLLSPQPARAEEPLTAAQLKAIRMECIGNVRKIVAAAHHYAADNEGNLPKSLDKLEPYLHARPDSFSCPFDPKKEGCGYEFVLLEKKMQHVLRPESTPMLRAKFAQPDGSRIVGFADGHVELIKDAEKAK